MFQTFYHSIVLAIVTLPLSATYAGTLSETFFETPNGNTVLNTRHDFDYVSIKAPNLTTDIYFQLPEGCFWYQAGWLTIGDSATAREYTQKGVISGSANQHNTYSFSETPRGGYINFVRLDNAIFVCDVTTGGAAKLIWESANGNETDLDFITIPARIPLYSTLTHPNNIDTTIHVGELKDIPITTSLKVDVTPSSGEIVGVISVKDWSVKAVSDGFLLEPTTVGDVKSAGVAIFSKKRGEDESLILDESTKIQLRGIHAGSFAKELGVSIRFLHSKKQNKQ